MSRYLLFLVLSVLPAVALGTDYIVGDDMGWTVGFDYEAWAKDKTFVVGDALIFHYQIGAHNVHEVNEIEFASCSSSGDALTSGNDKIVLKSPGKKWYIGGVGQHCVLGQKLAITVHCLSPMLPPIPAPIPAPTPSPTSYAKNSWISQVTID
ncbi:hypothetical protein NMG60_11001622 [Bertholletia excelsa]